MHMYITAIAERKKETARGSNVGDNSLPQLLIPGGGDEFQG